MIITGIPYSLGPLNSTQTGGTPYGASHLSGHQGELPISEDEKALCIAQGKYLASTALKLSKD
jgi:NAD(P)H dehydrogenase (quinone)